MYVLNYFRNHSIPVGKCNMLFSKIISILELLQHGFGKSAILLTHSLKHVFFTFESADSCLQSVQHCCKEV